MNEEELKNYQKTIYSFKPQEIAKLSPWDAQVQLGAIAERVLAGILRSECLKRIGVKNSPDVKVDYDMITEQFTVYVPKLWCYACKNRKAKFSYNNQTYCEDCGNLIKQQIETKKVKEDKEEKPKKKGKK